MSGRILGAVIAGGRSRRFGSDKALAPIDGRPMIAHVLAALAPWVDELAVCGRDYPDVLSLPDRPVPNLGPLGGIGAALYYAQAAGFEAVITAPCDTPRLSAEILRALRGRQGPACVAGCPVIGIWPTRFAVPLERFIATDPRRSALGWARTIGALELALDPPVNINRVADCALLHG